MEGTMDQFSDAAFQGLGQREFAGKSWGVKGTGRQGERHLWACGSKERSQMGEKGKHWACRKRLIPSSLGTHPILQQLPGVVNGTDNSRSPTASTGIKSTEPGSRGRPSSSPLFSLRAQARPPGSSWTPNSSPPPSLTPCPHPACVGRAQEAT